MTQTKLDSFTLAYIEAALWSSTDDNDEPMDRNYSINDLAPEALSRMVSDCAKFQSDGADTLDSAECTRGSGQYTTSEQSGHDFWLTRNRHGSGFWDGDWSEPHGAQLDALSKQFGECNLYVGDDGMIYCG